MRRFLLAAVMFGAGGGAQAADMPDLPILRGGYTAPTPPVNWQGYYLGGQAGYGSSDENFKGSTSNMISALAADNVIQQMGVGQWNLGLGKQSQRSSAFGAFGGYNSQWEDVVLGLEASYVHGSFGGTATARQGPLAEPLSDSYYHSVTAISQSAIAISDMATFRARAGYAYGSFLPYMFGGFALGDANITQTATIHDEYAPTLAGTTAPCNSGPPPFCYTLSATNAQHNHLVYGYTAGLGVDVNLVGGLFLRAEWEYVRFTAAVDTSINTVRAGLGYKF
jgi:opacity protein-like surface antigen